MSLFLAALGGLGISFGRLGAQGHIGSSAPNAPVLALISVVSNAATFSIDVDNTIEAGDSVQLQIQVAGGAWSPTVTDTTHIITSGEDSANEIDLTPAGFAAGNFEARARVIRALGSIASGWSNIVPFTVSFDAATIAWVAAVVAAGGSVSAPREAIVDTFIRALKSAGLFSTLDRFWLLAGENIQSALIDMVSLQSATQVGTPFSANVGVIPVSNTGYFDSNYVPSSSSLFTQDNATFGGQISNSRTSAAANNTPNFGSSDAGFTVVDSFVAFSAASTLASRVNSANADSTSAAQAKGLWTCTRTGAGVGAVYLNGSSALNISQTSAGRSTTSMIIGTFKQGASISTTPGDTIASFFVGSGWSAAQAANFYSAHNAMMTSLGIPVP